MSLHLHLLLLVVVALTFVLGKDDDFVINVVAQKGRDKIIDFNRLIADKLKVPVYDLSVVLEDFASSGSLLDSKGSSTSKFDSNNIFKYQQKPIKVRDKTVYPVGDAAGEKIVFTATFANGPGGDITSVGGVLAIDVVNSVPIAHPGSTLAFDSQPTVISVWVEDYDAKDNPNIDIDDEIDNVSIVVPPGIGKFTQQRGLFEFLFDPMGMEDSSATTFQYRVRDNSGNWSNVAFMTIQAYRMPTPIAANHTYYVTPIGGAPSDELTRMYYFDLSITSMHQSSYVFYIQKVSSPFYGVLSKGRGEQSATDVVKDITTYPYMLYKGPKSRVVLSYEAPKTVPSTVTEQTIEYYATDETITGDHKSTQGTITIKFLSGGLEDRRPLCGKTRYDPVFWDRPQRRVRLNYSVAKQVYGLNNTNQYIRNLMLIKGPTRPIGDLYLARSFADIKSPQWTALKPGDTFTDRDGRLRYSVRLGERGRSGVDRYYFRAENNYGDVCSSKALGVIEFNVVGHNGMDTSGKPLRRESMRLGGVGLFKIDRVAKGVVYDRAVFTSEMPTYGRLYRVSERTIYTQNMYNYGLGSRPFCDRTQCEPLFGDPIIPAVPVVVPIVLQTENGTMSPSEIRFFYRPRPELSMRGGMVEKLSYKLETASGQRSEEMLLWIYLTRGKLREVVITYSAPIQDPDRTDFKDEQLIEVRLQDKAAEQSKRVSVLPFDMERRHGIMAPFRLYQYQRNGPTLVRGPQVTYSNFLGVTDMWVTNESTVILVPKVSARRQTYKFRARYYPYNPVTNTINTQIPDVVRIVVRRKNTPARMTGDPIQGTVVVKQRFAFDLQAEDDEGDRVSFLVLKPPKFGYVMQEVEGFFGAGTTRLVHAGGRIRVPRWTGTRSKVRVFYESDSVKMGQQYPLIDTFQVAADDGGGVLSQPTTITIVIHKNKDTLNSISDTGVSTSTSVIVSAMFVGLFLGVAAYFYRKRLRRYLPLGTQDVEMTTQG